MTAGVSGAKDLEWPESVGIPGQPTGVACSAYGRRPGVRGTRNARTTAGGAPRSHSCCRGRDGGNAWKLGAQATPGAHASLLRRSSDFLPPSSCWPRTVDWAIGAQSSRAKGRQWSWSHGREGAEEEGESDSREKRQRRKGGCCGQNSGGGRCEMCG
ncbi:hypothetical protein OH77DRAFT_1016287 [Trametes cingulata]|nr:hypothetical protein OH77DRAFT_1016287 [Trametes cingulata]